ncbi:hypothetical protein GCM10011425_13460 [Mucilaginibacter galii]|uniref:Uncharacterized protein n=1 Tax=Mucilaginibacter galii TaxID=2005073 RepID=A0A917N157_9SPHI|nr:hypothetical protein GCM10011425_13460 [Mucilaginibacter galii]
MVIEKPSVWEADKLFPTGNFTSSTVKNGSIKLFNTAGSVSVCTWDTTTANNEQAFAARKMSTIGLPYGFSVNIYNVNQILSQRFLVFSEGVLVPLTLKIRALDNGNHDNFLEIQGKNLDPAFRQFEYQTYSGLPTYRIIGDYILIPYKKIVPNSPDELIFAVIKIKAKVANQPAEATDALAIEKVTLVNDVNTGINFYGAIEDITTLKDKFVVSTYGSRTPQICTIDLNGRIENKVAISSNGFIPQPNNVLLGIKNSNVDGNSGFYRSADLGKSWNVFNTTLPAGFGLLSFYTINNTLIGIFNKQLFEVAFTGDDSKLNLNIKELTTEGLPEDIKINGIFVYGPQKIALTTNKGVYAKDLQDLLIQK